VWRVVLRVLRVRVRVGPRRHGGGRSAVARQDFDATVH
jgi:hypothetical protein